MERYYTPPAGIGFLVWRYNNEIEFDRELTISVDSVFARLQAEDGDVKAAVDDFRLPAYRLLSDKYGIQLSGGEIEADAQSRKFVLKTENVPWPLNDDVGLINSPLWTLPASKSLGANYRWRAHVVNAEVGFNSLAPRRVSVKAEILVEIQERLPNGQWKNIQLNDKVVRSVGHSLKQDLNRAYRQYMKDRYGFEVTSSRVGGLNE
jgi:hypothetical protein